MQLQDHPAHRALDGSLHAVHFYSDHAGLIERLADYVAEGITARENCVVIATPGHTDALRRRLRSLGVEPSPHQLTVLDAAATLQGFMRSGRPDPALFDATVGRLVRSTARKPGGLRAYGEMVAVLWAYGNAVGALELEELWNELQRSVKFPLLCAYPTSDLHLPDGDGLTEICVRHTERSWY